MLTRPCCGAPRARLAADAMWAIAVPHAAGLPTRAGPLGQDRRYRLGGHHPAAKLRFLAADLRRALPLPFHTIPTNPARPRDGGRAGWLVIRCCAGSTPRGPSPPGAPSARMAWHQPRPDGRWLDVGRSSAALARVVLLHLSQYLVWTLVGAARIEGLQGRLLVRSCPCRPAVPGVARAVPPGRGSAPGSHARGRSGARRAGRRPRPHRRRVLPEVSLRQRGLALPDRFTINPARSRTPGKGSLRPSGAWPRSSPSIWPATAG